MDSSKMNVLLPQGSERQKGLPPREAARGDGRILPFVITA